MPYILATNMTFQDQILHFFFSVSKRLSMTLGFRAITALWKLSENHEMFPGRQIRRQ